MKHVELHQVLSDRLQKESSSSGFDYSNFVGFFFFLEEWSRQRVGRVQKVVARSGSLYFLVGFNFCDYTIMQRRYHFK